MSKKPIVKNSEDQLIPRYFASFTFEEGKTSVSPKARGKNITIDDMLRYMAVGDKSKLKQGFISIGEFDQGETNKDLYHINPNGLLWFMAPCKAKTEDDLRRELMLLQLRLINSESRIAIVFYYAGVLNILYSANEQDTIEEMADRISEAMGISKDNLNANILICPVFMDALKSVVYMQDGYLRFKNCTQEWINENPGHIIFGV